MRLANRNCDRCNDCTACRHVACPAGRLHSKECIGCGICQLVCPSDAIELRHLQPAASSGCCIRINGQLATVETGTPLIDTFRSFGLIGAQDTCSCGGCWTCAAVVDGYVRLACTTIVADGMDVLYPVPTGEPLRRATIVEPHYGGACGTPFSYRLTRGRGNVMEIVTASSGCNFRCPTCQAFGIAFGGRWAVMDSQGLAGVISRYAGYHAVDRVIISGGEPTLNVPWLLSLMKYLKDDRAINFVNLDTNGSLLSSDLLEELCILGLTNLSLDLKAIRLGTFMNNTGVGETELAKKFLKNAWTMLSAAMGIEGLYVGVGIPFNPALIVDDELREIGTAISGIRRDIQVSLIDVRPAFRRNDIERPTVEEMLVAQRIMLESGLENVWALTPQGPVSPRSECY